MHYLPLSVKGNGQLYRKLELVGINCAADVSSAVCLGTADTTVPPEEDVGSVIRSRVSWLTRSVWNSLIAGDAGEDDLEMMYWEDEDGNKGPEGTFPVTGSTVVIPPGRRCETFILLSYFPHENISMKLHILNPFISQVYIWCWTSKHRRS